MVDLIGGLTRPVGPLPAWGWGAVGGVGIAGVVWLRNRGSGAPAQGAAAGTMLAATPTTDQLSSNAINDLKNTLGAYQDRNDQAIGDTQASLGEFMAGQAATMQAWIDQQNAQQAALAGQLATDAQAYQQQLATSNASFLEGLRALLATAPGNTAAPITSGGLPDVGVSLPLWAQAKLAGDPDARANSAYLFNTFLSPSGPYAAVLDAYGRSDNRATGGVTSGEISAATHDQLMGMIQNNLAVRNPYFTR